MKTIHIGPCLLLEDFPDEEILRLQELCTFKNPSYEAHQRRMDLYSWGGKSKNPHSMVIKTWSSQQGKFCVPRGLLYDLQKKHPDAKVVSHLVDIPVQTSLVLSKDIVLFDDQVLARDVLCKYNFGNLWAPTGSGKCLGKGTPVLLYNGSIKPVEDINVGDVLIGPDSGPRHVLSITKGIGPLYRVTPTKGDSYIVNDAHILSLKITRGATKWNCSRSDTYKAGKIHNITVLDYLSRSKTFKHCSKGWRTGVNFTLSREVTMPPYLMGVWLGDGNSRLPSITSADKEVSKEWCAWGSKMGLGVRIEVQPENKSSNFYLTNGRGKGKNAVLEILREYSLIQNKHIPAPYLTRSRLDRLELLAGLIDTDGSESKGGFDVIFKNKRLAYDTTFLARSLSFAAYISECRKTCCNNGVTGTYWRISISGDCTVIPVRISRKKAKPRTMRKDPMLVGLSVEHIGKGEYFGFEIDDDRLFLLGDFTVTHNTVSAFAIAEKLQLRTLFLVDRDVLIRQVTEEVRELLGIEPGLIKGPKFDIQDFTIGSVQTLKRRDASLYEKEFSCLFVDESHLASSDTYLNVVNKLHCKHVYGLSGTPTDGRLPEVMLQCIGPVIHKIKDVDLQRQGRIATITVNRVNTPYKPSRVFDPFEKPEHLEELTTCPIRNQFIISDLIQALPGTKAVVLTERIDHAILIHKALCAAFPGTDPILYHGKLKDKVKTVEFARMKAGASDIAVATYQAVGTGLDIRSWDHVCLATPLKSPVMLKQALGRGRRVRKGKTTVCTVRDYVDVLDPLMNERWCFRLDMYKELKAKIQ